jgi:simple sugar transport system ATP-binding protein
LKDAAISLRAGEILGIAGVDGNGQSHLAQVILKTLAPTRGEILINGASANALSTRQRLDHIAFIAEDRQREALILPLSIEGNLLLKDYRERRFNALGWLRFAAWRRQSRELMRQFDIRANSPTATVGRLSGGNQQKVVLARELSADKPIVLAVNPTRGLDVGATAFVLQTLLDARARGAAVLLIHSDLDELLAISDRVAVLFNGTLTDTPWPNTTKEAIGRLMLGLPAEAAA